ncbi:hypothetical protein TNCV_202551 [Trichonephila clavipes]|nr:hypothetical protein TNCV_202551 [Trichonephila clavipes]
MNTVSEDRVKLCGYNKNVSFLNEDGVCRQECPFKPADLSTVKRHLSESIVTALGLIRGTPGFCERQYEDRWSRLCFPRP